MKISFYLLKFTWPFPLAHVLLSSSPLPTKTSKYVQILPASRLRGFVQSILQTHEDFIKTILTSPPFRYYFFLTLVAYPFTYSPLRGFQDAEN